MIEDIIIITIGITALSALVRRVFLWIKQLKNTTKSCDQCAACKLKNQCTTSLKK